MNNKRLSDIEIEIMRYAAGGMTGNKTYHQVRDQFMPMDSESMGYANGGGIGTMMKPKKKTLKAVNELQAKAPEGEFLAYINQGEANALKNSGGSGHLVNGIPSFVGSDYSGAGNANTSGYQGGMRGNSGYQGGSYTSPSNSGGSGNFTTPTYTPPTPPEDIDSTYTANSFNTNPKTKSGIFGGGFNPLAMILGLINPFLGIASRGIMGLKNKFNDVTNNPNDLSLRERLTGYKTQKEYDKARFDRQQVNRLDKLYAAKDKGYNSLFGLKTTDFTKGQQDKIDYIEQYYDPSTARNVDSARGSGLRNTLAANNMTKSMPNANITGLNNNDFDGVTGQDRSITSGQIDEFQNQLGGMNLNDYETGNPGGMVQPNDFLTGNPSQYGLNSNSINEFATSPQFNTSLIDEFGDNRNINMDEFADNNMQMQNYLTDQASFQQPITASQIDEFGDNRNINMNEFAGNDIQMQNYLTDQANYNADPLGNPNFDSRVVPEEYGLVGNNGIASLTNNGLPGNNQFAEVTQMDLDRKNQFGMLDYDTAKDIGMISPNLTQEEFEGIKSGAITAVG